MCVIFSLTISREMKIGFKYTPMKTNLFLLVGAFALTAVSPLQARNLLAPPIPASLIERANEEGRPMLIAGRDQTRDTERRMRRFLEERGDEFMMRVEGFFNPDSPWYIGEGPFAAETGFSPGALDDKGFLLYSKLLVELSCYLPLERERWGLHACQEEFLRLLDELERPLPGEPLSMTEPAVSPRRAMMLAWAALLYDICYFRFDTIDRREPSLRLKAVRDRLAAFARGPEAANLSPGDAIAVGSGLGLSTLMCLSIFPYQWGDDDGLSASIFLPDLYAAAGLTRRGLYEWVDEQGRFTEPFERMELLLLAAIPFTQTMERLGYPYAAAPGAYSRLARQLERHRVPSQPLLVSTAGPDELRTAWAPLTYSVFHQLDLALYDKPQSATRSVSVASQQDGFTNMPGVMPRLPGTVSVNTRREGSGRPTLKWQLQMFDAVMNYEPSEPSETPAEPEPQRDPGWARTDMPPMPAPWGAVYYLGSREDNTSALAARWIELCDDGDNHPFSFYFFSAPRQEAPVEFDASLIQYPGANLSIYSMQQPRETCLIAMQTAQNTVLASTMTATHESVLFFENDMSWRWFHDIYGATPPAGPRSADGELIAPTAGIHQPGPALETSLYSVWEHFTPNGRTLAVRRHEGTVGSAYSIFAHFPDNPATGMRNFTLSLPEEAHTELGEVGEWVKIEVAGDETADEVASLRDFQVMRALERRGRYSPDPSGTLNLLFSPESIRQPMAADGVLGEILDIEFTRPLNPFFYIAALEQRGREQFELKYGMVPFPGLRVIEWHEGIEVIAVNTGEGIDNPFVESDADLVLATRDSAMKAVFYVVVNGTYAKVSFSPTQRTPFSLLSADEPVTVAWAGRRIHTLTRPENGSVFYAPQINAFYADGEPVRFGRKRDQAVVLSER